MAKRKQFIKPFADSEANFRTEKRHGQDREDFTEQGITIKWSWIQKLIEYLKQGKRNRIKRNREKNVNTKISSSK